MADQAELPPDEEGELVELSDTNLGQPLAELQNLGWQPREDFGRRVGGRIERRLLTGRLLDMA